MPPKLKKEKEGKGGKTKISTPIDDVDTTALSRTQLEEFCVKVHEALENEQQHCDFLRLERDKLVNIAAIAREQLVLAKHGNYRKQMELDDVQESRRREMENSRVKLINLRREKHSEYIDTKLESVKLVELEQTSHENRLKEIHNDINELKSESKEVKECFYEANTSQEIENAKQRCKIRDELIEMYNLIENKWEKKVNNELNTLNGIFKQEYDRLKNRKLRESSQLIKNNDKFAYDLNHYYKNIVQHNLNLISHLKSNLREIKIEIAVVEKNLGILRTKNKELRESLSQSNTEKQTLNEKLTHSARYTKELNKTKKELKRKKETLEDLKIELFSLTMAADKQEEIVDEATQENEKSIFTLKIIMEEIVLVLEYMASHLKHRLDELDSMLNKLASNEKFKLDPSLSFRPAKDCLTWDLATIADHHDQILQNYHQLLQKYDIHPDDTGFTPLLSEEILKKVKYLRILVNEEVFEREPKEKQKSISLS